MGAMTARLTVTLTCAMVAALTWPVIAQGGQAKNPQGSDSRIPLSERKRVAVLPFDDGAIREGSYFGQVFNVGLGVADMLTTALVKANRFRVIEREKVEAVLAEQDLAKSGRVDPATAAKIGKILGADYLLMGRVTEFSVETKGGSIGGVGRGDLRDLSLSRSTADVKLDGRLVDSTTTEIIFAFTGAGHDSRTNVGISVQDIGRLSLGSAEFFRTILGVATRQAVDSAVQQLATGADQAIYRPPDLSQINGYVVYVEGPKIMTNLGARYGVKPEDRFQILRRGQEIRDPGTGELLTVITQPVGILRIESVEDKVSIGSLAESAGDLKVQIGDMVKPAGS